MTHGFFLQQLERVKKYFGPENYPKEKAQLIWEECRDLPDGAFFRVVSFFIAERRPDQAPHLSHFKEQAEVERKALFTQAVKKVGAEFVGEKKWPSQGLRQALEDENLRKLHDAILKRRRAGGEK